MTRTSVKWVLVAFIMLGFSCTTASSGLFNQPVKLAEHAHIVADQPRAMSVPYVPTPMRVVEKMLEMAEVDEDDLVYDLGSGDGRIVITAAKERGARGVGIDNNPVRIKESLLNAEKANVTDLVEFREADIFQTNFSEATVVTLYLLSTVNRELRPKLLQDLKPGTRVVSHAFDMDEWEPDQTASVNNNSVYFWVVPANVSGIWEWTENNKGGDVHYRLELKQTFQNVTGTLVENMEAYPIEDAELVGDRMEFAVTRPSDRQPVTTRYEVHLNGNRMEGRPLSKEQKRGALSNWEALRDPVTITPLERMRLIQQVGT